jgi:hypothetical protein
MASERPPLCENRVGQGLISALPQINSSHPQLSLISSPDRAFLCCRAQGAWGAEWRCGDFELRGAVGILSVMAGLNSYVRAGRDTGENPPRGYAELVDCDSQGCRFVRRRRSAKRGSERSGSNMGFVFIYPTLTIERSS